MKNPEYAFEVESGTLSGRQRVVVMDNSKVMGYLYCSSQQGMAAVADILAKNDRVVVVPVDTNMVRLRVEK